MYMYRKEATFDCALIIARQSVLNWQSAADSCKRFASNIPLTTLCALPYALCKRPVNHETN